MKRTVQYLAGGLLSAALIFGGFSYAQSVAAQTSTPTPAVTTPGNGPAVPMTGDGPAVPMTDSHHHGRGPAGFADSLLAQTVATALGVTTDELHTQLDVGKSMADLLAAAEIDQAQVISDYLAAERDALDAAVAAGTVTETRAAVILADAEATVDERLAQVHGGLMFGHRDSSHAGLLASVADALQLTPAELRTQLSTGNTPAALLAAAGIDQATVIADFLSDLKTRLGSLVSIGALTQAQADARLADAEASAADRLAQTMPADETGGIRGGQGHHGGRGGHDFDGRGGHGFSDSVPCDPNGTINGTVTPSDSGLRGEPQRNTVTD